MENCLVEWILSSFRNEGEMSFEMEGVRDSEGLLFCVI